MYVWQFKWLSLDLGSHYLRDFLSVRNANLTRLEALSELVSTSVLSFLFNSNNVRVS